MISTELRSVVVVLRQRSFASESSRGFAMATIRWPLACVLAWCVLTSVTSVQSFQELSIGETSVTNHLNAKEPLHTFSFVVDKAGRYRISTTGATQVQLDLISPKDSKAFDPANYKGKRYTPDLVNQSIECELPTGEYQIRVQHAFPGGVGEFGVRLERLEGNSQMVSKSSDRQTRSAVTARLWLQTGHGRGQIEEVKFSASAQRILTTGNDATYLWDAATGRELRTFGTGANAAAIDPTEALIITASDGATSLWDAKTGANYWTEAYKGVVATHALFLDSRSFLTIRQPDLPYDETMESTVELWKITDERKTDRLATKVIPLITAVGETPTGDAIWFGCRDGAIRRYHRAAQRIEDVVSARDAAISALAITPDHSFCYFVSDERKLFRAILESGTIEFIVDLNEFKPARDAKANRYFFHDYEFSADASQLLIGISDGTARLWSTADGQEIRSFNDEQGDVKAVSYSADRSRLLTGNSEGFVTNWDVSASDTPVRLVGEATIANAMHFSSDGAQVYFGLNDGTVRAWNLDSGQQRTLNERGGGELFDFVVSDRDETTYVGGSGWSVGVLKGGSTEGVFEAFRANPVAAVQYFVTSLAYSPTKTLLAGAGSGSECRVYDTEQAKVIAELVGHEGFISSISFSPDGDRLATGGSDGSVRLWDPLTGKELLQFQVDSGDDVRAVAFSPADSNLIAAATSKGNFHVWRVNDRAEIYVNNITGVQNGKSTSPSIVDFAFTPDGQQAFCGCSDSIARLLDLRDKSFVRDFKGHFNSIRAVAVSPSSDRKLGVTGSYDKKSIVWDLSTGQPICTLVSLRSGGWFVLDEENRFDADSLENTRGVHWIFSDSPFMAGPPSLFQQQYYEPSLLARKIKGESFSPVGDITELNRAQPRVRIVEVKRSRDFSDTVDICVQAEVGELSAVRGEEPLTMKTKPYDLRLFRDGQLVGQFPPMDDRFEAPSDISNEGDLQAWQQATDILAHPNVGGSGKVWFRGVALPHRLRGETATWSAYAFNDQRVRSEIATFEYNIPTDLTPPHPKAYVLSVGVNTYETPAWNLQFAANDAVEFERIMRLRLGEARDFDVVSIPLISETGKHTRRLDATKENIRLVLQQLGSADLAHEELIGLPGDARLLTKATPDDVLIVFFAGHGFTATDGTFYFFPYDIGAKNFSLSKAVLEKSISSTEISKWLRDVDVGAAVMIIDACQSASIVKPPGFKIGPFGSRGLGQLAYDKGMQVLAASQSEQVAVEISDLGHGLLTYAIIQDGIVDRKAADRNDALTLSSCLAHAQQNVRRIYEGLLSKAAADTPDTTRLMRLNTSRSALMKVDSRLTDFELRELRGLPVQEPALFDFNRSKVRIRLGQSATPSEAIDGGD